MFVTFEGCDGVGKSTQLRLLKAYLERTEQSAVFVYEPGSTRVSEVIRQLILNPEHKEMTAETEALLYAAARAQLIKEIIKPALDAGQTVICDRYIDSSVAYQGFARGLGTEFVMAINKIAVDEAMPDLTIFIDRRPSESFRSVKHNDRLEQEKEEFHMRVYDGYIAQIRASKARIITVTPDFDKEVTHSRILDALKKHGVFK